jgi:hypothetical protein
MTILVQVVNGAYVRKFDDSDIIEWGEDCRQPAHTLSDAQRIQYGILPFTYSAQPSYNALTQTCGETDPALVNGAWTQQWVVTNMNNNQLRITGKAAADSALASALSSGFTYGGVLHHCDATFQAQVQGFVLMFQTGIIAPTATVPIRVMADNSVVNMTQAQLIAFAGALGAYVLAAYQTNWASKDALPVGV